MRPSKAGQTYVCLSCLLRQGARSRSAFVVEPEVKFATTQIAVRAYTTSSPQSAGKRPRISDHVSTYGARSSRRSNSSSVTEAVQLDPAQTAELGRLHGLQQKLHDGLSQVPGSKGSPEGVPIEKVLTAIKPQLTGTDDALFETIEKVYAGRSFKAVQRDLINVSKHRHPSLNAVEDKKTIRILGKLGLIKEKPKKQKEPKAAQAATSTTVDEEAAAAAKGAKKSKRLRKIPGVVIRKQAARANHKSKAVSITRVKGRVATGRKGRPKGAATSRSTDEPSAKIIRAPPDAKSIDASLIEQVPIEKEATLPVPKLSFDLSRVLFNPGVYHLQDPRSRVYNFDPYLEKIMPVTEFNFDALNPYITSSADEHLRRVSMKHNKRYIGSSSSMSGAMSHFHFLLSAWRPLDMSMLSQQIEGRNNFTVITKAPSGIFLRWRNGVYAVDADKEHDSPNILMMQGKSMEKLLTLEKEDFEKYRKPKAGEQAPAIDSDPESYHYSGCENFLLRSQLDAWDPRLPGTGMFDLKTRACAGIRMDMSNHEQGMGYQIKERFGAWESFDREYFDMMRAAFLKYSLQVRMGRMDGIFVAYHNIERIFGFQYVSLSELDAGLHGQTDPSLGDQEFKVTVKLMNEIFDLATKEYPEQSLRFVFETREATQRHPNGFMRIFAEPMSEENIDKIQEAGKSKVEEYEKNMAGSSQALKSKNMGGQSIEAKLSPSTLESSSADTAFLEEILGQDAEGMVKAEDVVGAPGPVACWTLNIHNEVNGQAVVRPQELSSSDRWTVKYQIARLDETEARGLYSSCQQRRGMTLGTGIEARKEGYFIQKIRQLSREGRTWREEQDDLDAQRQQVVLYSQTGTMPDP